MTMPFAMTRAWPRRDMPRPIRARTMRRSRMLLTAAATAASTIAAVKEQAQGETSMTMTYKRQTALVRCGCCEPTPAFASTAVNRRSFLAGSAAVGLGMAGARQLRPRHGDGAARRKAAPDRRPPPHRPAGAAQDEHRAPAAAKAARPGRCRCRSTTWTRAASPTRSPRSSIPGPGTARSRSPRGGSRASATTTPPSSRSDHPEPLRHLRRDRAGRHRGQPARRSNTPTAR